MLRAIGFGRAFLAIVLVSGLALLLSSFSNPLAADGDEAADAAFRTGEAAILAALEEPTELEFTETPLEEVIEYLGNKHRVARVSVSQVGGKYALLKGGWQFD